MIEGASGSPDSGEVGRIPEMQRSATTWKRELGLLVIVAALCLLGILYLDPRITLYLYEHQPPEMYRFFLFLSQFGSGNVWYPVVGVLMIGGFVMWRHAPSRRMKVFFGRISRLALFAIASIGLTGLVAVLTKTAFGRLRPRFLIYDDLYRFEPFGRRLGDGDVAFPSGHSQVIFASMTVLALLFPRWRLPLFLVAALIASSRVFIQVHFFSDVVLGAYVGAFGTILIYAWCRKRGIDLSVPRLSRVRRDPARQRT